MTQKGFYETVGKLDELKKTNAPTTAELQYVIEIITGDAELTRYFYYKNEQGALNAGWLELLDGAGEFAELGTKEASLIARIKALYIVDCASVKPEPVLEIIKKLDAKDSTIQGILIDAILNMPDEIAVNGVAVAIDCLERRDRKDWYFIGQRVAKFMVKLLEINQEEAFEIAKLLLDVWRQGEKEAGVFETVRSKFATHEYKELIFTYYSKVWEKQPFEATRVLVEIYNRYLEECIKEKGYDVSEYLGVSVEDLEDIRQLEYDIDPIVMKAMCEAGQAVIAKEPQKVRELLEDLEKRNKGVFHRVEMYLLRFVPPGTEKDRINKLIGNQKFIENPLYKYEHRRLLNDKFDKVSDETKKTFIEWVKQEKINEELRKEIKDWCEKNQKTIPDFEKMENRAKAEELYLVRERFKELYEQYKKGAGVKDDFALAPHRMVGEARFVDRAEGAELNKEEMLKMNPVEVIKLVSTKKDWGKAEKDRGLFSGEVAQAEVFGRVVKERIDSYLAIETEKIAVIPKEFLEKFLNAIWIAAREGKTKNDCWGWILSLCHMLVEENKEKEEYRGVFLELLNVIREAFDKEDILKEVVSENIKTIWEIISPLVMFNEEKEQREWEYLRDSKGKKQEIVTASLNIVVGKAFETVIRLGVISKNKNKEYFDNTFWAQVKDVLEYVLTNIKRPSVWCIFGLWLPQLCYLNEQWVKDSLNRIFAHEEENDELWEAVFGTHVVRGGTSRQAFNVLKEGKEYEYATENLSREEVFSGHKSWKKGLTEHLMIAYFNGWIDFEDEVLKGFFEKAPAALRGEAARFLTTGFKTVNEKGGTEKEKVATRMREYWNKRLAAIEKDGQENIEETVEFAGWVKDSLLEAKETLELLERTLKLTDGKVGRMRDAQEFVEGVCELGKGNELIALRCLKKAAADENMRTDWVIYEDRLVQFLGQIADLPGDYNDAGNIRNKAIEVVDSYGRLHPDKFREVWEKLRG